MRTKENSRMFSRHLIDSQSSLHTGFWCSRNERGHKASLKEHYEKIIVPAFIFKTRRLIEDKIPVSLENIVNPTHPVIIGFPIRLLNSNKYFTLFCESVDHKLSKLFFGDFDHHQVTCQLNVGTYRFASVVSFRFLHEVAIRLPKSIKRFWQRNTLRASSPLNNLFKVKINHPLLKDKAMEFRVGEA